MEPSNYKKILIFGQPFNLSTGGGITLSNLYKNWPREKIAVLYVPWGEDKLTLDICNVFYRLGNEEHFWRFPFNLYKKPFPVSGLRDNKEIVTRNSYSIEKGFRHFFGSNIVNPFLNWLGLHHCSSGIGLSDKLKDWLIDFNPEVLYLQVSSLEGIEFSEELIKFLKIPTVIHMMDDWPSIISISGPFKYFWSKRIDLKFRRLLNNVDCYLSISDSMSAEYKSRYGKSFTAFHNPIDRNQWVPHIKKDFLLDKSSIRILYSGRIGLGIMNSLVEFASAIDSMNTSNLNIKLHIQTTTDNNRIINKLKRFSCVVINPRVDYNQIPQVFSQADFLLLSNDFSSTARGFLKLSMPTKASEYMISGTPVIVYAPKGIAVTDFFLEHKCGYCINENNIKEIIKSLIFLIENQEVRKTLSENAVQIALNRFDSEIVREKFRVTLLNVNK